MISLSHLNKSIYFTFFIYILIFNFTLGIAAVDIWEKKENENKQNDQTSNEKDTTIESPILSEDVNKIVIKIDEKKICCWYI